MNGHSSPLCVIILAAGEGSRMNSPVPKVLHPLGGRPLLNYALDTASCLKPEAIILVTSPSLQSHLREECFDALLKGIPLIIASQNVPLGTGHGVVIALQHVPSHLENKVDFLILYGDTPLITSQTLKTMLLKKQEIPHAAAMVLGFSTPQPREYGRLIQGEKQTVTQIIEYKDIAYTTVDTMNLCNSGVMLLDQKSIPFLKELQPHSPSKEYPLTQLIEILNHNERCCYVVEGEEREALGVNSQKDLALCENILQTRWRDYFLSCGNTLLNPESIFFSFDTVLNNPVTLHSHIVFGTGVTVETETTIYPFCYINQTQIGPHAQIGPFAHLRKGSRISEGVKIGSFVETKKAYFHPYAQAKHLSYVGDATIGMNTNIGGGSITCNYDGNTKHHTTLGKDVFVGANTSLIAPLNIEDGAVIAAGSTITHDVLKDELGIARSQQINKKRAIKKMSLKAE